MAQEKLKPIKVFFDTEFSGLHKLTTLISIGMVAEDGRKFYAEATDYDKYQISEYLMNNVLSKMILEDYQMELHYKPEAETVLFKGNLDEIKVALTNWVKTYSNRGVELWGDVCAYDKVLFDNIFGTAFDVPEFISYIPMDLATALKICGKSPDISRVQFAYGSDADKYKEDVHNALFDAETQFECYKKIDETMKFISSKMKEAYAEMKQSEVDETGKLENDGWEKTEESVDEKQEVIPPTQDELQALKDKFVEPTQEYVNSAGQEYKSPI